MTPQLAAARLAVRQTPMSKADRRRLLSLPPLYLVTWCTWAGITPQHKH